MTTEEILELARAGFTKDDIIKMLSKTPTNKTEDEKKEPENPENPDNKEIKNEDTDKIDTSAKLGDSKVIEELRNSIKELRETVQGINLNKTIDKKEEENTDDILFSMLK